MTENAPTDSIPAGGIFGTPTPRLFSIDAGRPFLADLAETILDEHQGCDPIALTRVTVFLPTRRSARVLADAFQRVSANRGQSALLLPSIKTLGDIDEDSIGNFSTQTAHSLNLPETISSTDRLLSLATLVAVKEKAFAGRENWAAAVVAARELGKLLDSSHTEEIDLSKLSSLAPETHAEHWAKSVEFLHIISDHWPQYLKTIDKMEAPTRRARLIDEQIAAWEQTTPTDPVILAGTTASAPAVRRLAASIALLPKGIVILPGLDKELAAQSAWEQIDEPHPQAGLKRFIEKLDLAPDDIRSWPGSGKPSPRNRLASLTLWPAEATHEWRNLVAEQFNDTGQTALKGLSLIETDDEDAEAFAISAIFRETLETPGKTATLITPDRNLSRRVSLKLRRWGVIIDDSAGMPLANSPIGGFLRLVASWLQQPNDGIALMALCQHPLTGTELSRAEKLAAVDELNIALRGRHICDDLEHLLSQQPAERVTNALKLIPVLKNVLSIWGKKEEGLEHCLEAHLNVAERLAKNDQGETLLWQSGHGEDAADALKDLIDVSRGYGIEPGDDYARIFAELVQGITVRQRSGSHPRLSILGPLEARMQTADIVVLGGLNEGSWPSDAGSDPFLSRPMRTELGLPLPESRIGLAAHDFAQLFASKTVYLTRSKRQGGSPSTPSRWLVRLKNILKGAGQLETIEASAQYKAWHKAIDLPSTFTRITPPAPRPPVAARPTNFYVTHIEKLMRDPYSIWARNIMKFYKLDALSPDFGPAARGQLLHLVFERFSAAHPSSLPFDGAAIMMNDLIELGRFQGLDAAMLALWHPQFRDAINWFLRFHENLISLGKPIVLEGKGEWTIETQTRSYTLNARADRIDQLHNGSVALIDYKSGSVPSKRVSQTFSPQLALTGMIARHGGFPELTDLSKPVAISSFDYIRILRRDERKKSDCQSGMAGDDAEDAIDEAERRLRELIAHYENPETVYLSQPRPQFKDNYGDYDQLARRREWCVEEENE